MPFSSFARNLILGTFCAAATALTASADTLNVKLVNAGSPSDIASSVTIDGVTKTGVYIGPYTLSINGGANTLAMCIDFSIASTVGSSYTGYETNIASNSNLSNTYGESSTIYEEEAYLFSQIIQPGADRLAIQEAAWDITADSITSDLNFFTYFGYEIGSTTVAGYINDAVDNYSSMSNAGYAVISDAVKGNEQEFIVSAPAATSVTPEPSSLVLMLAPALLFGAEAVRRHKLNQSFLS